jgi:hypothetical protein
MPFGIPGGHHMKHLLIRIGLIKAFTIELPVSSAEFIKVLSANIDEPAIDFFEVPFPGEKIYKGTVSYNSFELRRRKKFIDRGSWLIKINGRFNQSDANVKVDLELVAFHMAVIPLVAVWLLFGGYVVAVTLKGIFHVGEHSNDHLVLGLPILLTHAGFVFSRPYYALRSCLHWAKYNIERDLPFMMTN